MSELGKVIEELDPKAKYPDESVVHIRCGELRTLIAAAKRAEQAEAEVGRLREVIERYSRESTCMVTRAGLWACLTPPPPIDSTEINSRSTVTPPPNRERRSHYP